MPKANKKLEIVYVSIEKLLPYINNSRTHSESQIQQIVRSMKTFGFTQPVLIDADHTIIAGHGRTIAAKRLKMKEIPCIILKDLSDTEKRAYVIADNKLAENAGWDMEKLIGELSALVVDNFDATLMGFGDDEVQKLLSTVNEDIVPGSGGNSFSGLPKGSVAKPEAAKGRKGVGSLEEKFMIPPFSVLDARKGWWQDRKRAWMSLGIKGLGRDAALLLKGTEVAGHGMQNYRKEKGLVRESYENETHDGTSVFDPVIAELMYRWFCPRKGNGAIDMTCGGPERGIVASKLGIKYTGIDIRKEQIAHNNKQGEEICDKDMMPLWIHGDGVDVKELVPPKKYDFLFTCPPYAGLEQYSTLENDLSNMSYPVFIETLGIIIKRSCELLNHDRFAAIVVGDIRDKGTGFYCEFVADVIKLFAAAGLHFYNDAILITVAGSLPLRAGRQFSNSRKLGKTHQNILIFVKGDPKKATEACGTVDVINVLDEETTDL